VNTYKIIFPLILLFSQVFLSVAAIERNNLLYPDIIVESVALDGELKYKNGWILVPVDVKVRNIGVGVAKPFKLVMSYVSKNGKSIIPFRVPMKENKWYPSTDRSLEPGEGLTISGNALLSKYNEGETLFIFVEAGGCSLDQLNATSCRPVESNEANNSLSSKPLFVPYITRKPPESLDKIRKIAELGDVNSQIKLAKRLHSRHASKADISKAVKWYTKAADSGSGEAQFELGVMYRKGLVTGKREEKKGLKLIVQAANNNYIPAILSIALKNLMDSRFPSCDSTCVSKKEEIGFKWYEKAALLGSEKAKLKLCLAYKKGRYYDKDVEKSFRCLENLAYGSFHPAQLELAHFYSEGVFVDSNLPKAYLWYTLSRDKNYLYLLKKKMTEDQIELGKSLVKNGLPIK